MIVVYGKGRVGNSIKKFLNFIWQDSYVMDDSDYDKDILFSAQSIIVSPWIPPNNKVYLDFSQKIISESDFIYKYLQNKDLLSKFSFIWATWTDGKSTTSWIIYSLLEKILDKKKYSVFIGGNFDKPISEIVFEILQKNDGRKNILVLEFSSFMGYNLQNLKFDYSIRLNFHKDHLNWHKDMDDYLWAKKNIINATKYTAFLYTNLKQYSSDLKPEIVFFDSEEDFSYTNFLWTHNFINISGALKLVKSFLWKEFSDIFLKKVMKDIQPLEHRINLVKQIGKLRIYDDGKSTTVNSLKAALNSFDSDLVLIAGGSDKWDDFSLLLEIFEKKLWFWVFVWETSGKLTEIAKRAGKGCCVVGNLDEALDCAKEKATKLWINNLLFSPWCASFDMFKDRKDRVNCFLSYL